MVRKCLLACALAIAAATLIAALVSTSKGETDTPDPPARPKLVILIIIDQFRNDYLDRFRPYFVEGGFSRLLGGARLANCRYDNAITVTAVGHATLLTGAYPNIHGIIENDWYDRSLKRPVNCVEDLNTRIVDSAQGPSEERGSSPQYLIGSTLGDELRLASNFQSKVISVSLKDRGAVLAGGHTANAAFWFQPRKGRFVSSTYYMNQLPGWAAQFNDRLPVKEYCGKAWKALAPTPEAEGRVFEEYIPQPGEDCPSARFLSWFSSSPFLTEIELKFAREAIRQERLGQGPVTDLLTLSISANDFVGHRYGPYSPQVADMTLRTDRYLADFFADIDRTIGLGKVWIALSGDHGVAPTPQLVRERRLGMGIFRPSSIRDAVEASLSRTFGADTWTEWVDVPYIYLNQGTIQKHEVLAERVAAEAARAAMSVPGVFAAFTRADLMHAGSLASPMARKAANSFYGRRSGDVFVVLDPFAVPSGSDTETTHGSPWSYDAQVPLLLWGSAFRPGTYSAPCQPVDLAPTIAAALGLTVPSGATGSPLLAAMRGK